MSVQHHDGGAFAECLFAQYPRGLGRQPPSPAVISKLQQLQQQRLDVERTSTPAAGSSALVLASAPRDASTAAAAPVVPAPTEATRDALNATLHAAQSSQRAHAGARLEEDAFDSKAIRTPQVVRRAVGALSIVAPAAAGGGRADPAPIVRSPTKAPKRSAVDAFGADHSGATASTTTAVPFCVSSWRNKKKLIVPVEQRLAQQTDARRAEHGGGGISDGVMGLAMAMHRAAKDVGDELHARATARAAEEERQQAAREEEEMQRAKQLLEENAARVAQQQHRRGETREQRLERLRLERELREREKAQKQRQRQLQRAAARLNMSVEELEKDEALLRAVDRGEGDGAAPGDRGADGHAHVSEPRGDGAASALLAGSVKSELGGAPGNDDDDGNDGAGQRKKSSFQMFTRPVISNDGIAREMAALAELERNSVSGGNSTSASAQTHSAAHDGIKLPNADDDEDENDIDGADDEDGGFAMDALLRKRQRRL